MLNGRISHNYSRAYTSLVLTGISLLLISGAFPKSVDAFTQVLISTAAPIGLEKKFLDSVTAQYDGKIVPNPLASNTYTLTLYGNNPNFNAPPSTLEQALSLGATVYVYGFANGMTYQQAMEEGLVGSYGNRCSTPTAFGLVQATTTTWSNVTCLDVIGTIEENLFEQSLSTPTPIPPEP